MDEENKTATPPAVEPAKADPPAQPQVDVDAIIKKATAEASAAAEKKAEEKLRKTFAVLSGQEEKPVNPIHEAFVNDPITLLNAHKDVVKKELRDEMAKEQQRNASIAAEMKKVADEYPQITEYTDVVEGKFIQLKVQEPDATEAELIKRASKFVADKLKLKPLTAAEQEERQKQSALPPANGVVGYAPTNKFDNQKSSLDFINARKAHFEKFTKPS